MVKWEREGFASSADRRRAVQLQQYYAKKALQQAASAVQPPLPAPPVMMAMPSTEEMEDIWHLATGTPPPSASSNATRKQNASLVQRAPSLTPPSFYLPPASPSVILNTTVHFPFIPLLVSPSAALLPLTNHPYFASTPPSFYLPPASPSVPQHPTMHFPFSHGIPSVQPYFEEMAAQEAAAKAAQEASQAKAAQEEAAKAAQEASQAKALQEAAQAKAAQEAAAKAAHETMLRRESDAAAIEREGVVAAIEREGVVADEWERFELRCVLSFTPLTDPAKGSSCMHRACFNYDVLRDYVGRVGKAGQIKECPLATCRARLQRTRDVERDSMLKTALSAAPPNTTSVWLRGYEVRMEAASTAVEANGRSGGRKRSQRGTTLPVESDDLSLCRSGRHCVIVL